MAAELPCMGIPRLPWELACPGSGDCALWVRRACLLRSVREHDLFVRETLGGRAVVASDLHLVMSVLQGAFRRLWQGMR